MASTPGKGRFMKEKESGDAKQEKFSLPASLALLIGGQCHIRTRGPVGLGLPAHSQDPASLSLGRGNQKGGP